MEFDFGKYDRQHLRNIAQMAREIEALFEQLNQKAVQLVTGAGIDASSEDFDFFFGDFPAVNKQMGDALQEFHNSMQHLVERGDEQAWLLSNEKNAAMLASLQRRAGWSDERLQQLQKPNVDALQAFQQRKENGMNLSQRVWNLTEQHKQSLELALECGLADGTDARKLSQVVRRYLNEPNRLFRRVRDKKTGQLRLSKAAAAYHPGRGVYRSSYKNALRMTGTEINMAYRTADSDKWQQLDMVLGVEVHVSPTNHTLNGVPFFDICDELAGTYPKEFKFVGWHPNCRCMAVPKLPSRKELNRYKKAIWQGKEDNFNFRGNVTEMPENFTGWVAANTDKILAAKNTPYFIRDNYTGGDISKGYRWLTKAEKKVQPLTTLEKAAQRHAARTEEEIAAIRRMAANRQKLIAEGYDSDFANLRRHAAEWGVDISKVENLFSSENFANMREFRTFLDNMLEHAEMVFGRIGEWSNFRSGLRLLSKDAAGAGARGMALIKRMDIKNFEALKRTFTNDQLNELRNNLSEELEAIKAHRREVKELWDKRKAAMQKQKQGTELTDSINDLKQTKITSRKVEKLSKKLTDDEIIARVGGGDDTKGSCSSLAFTFAGNKGGLDVLDFRDGESRQFFARSGNIQKIVESVGGKVVENYNEFKNANVLLGAVEKGKYYYFACARHAAIVRKIDSGFQYLELQSGRGGNGWHELTNSTLRYRFGARKSHTFYGTKLKSKDCIVDIDLLNKDAGFRNVLEYINTEASKQRKSIYGTMK